MVEGLKLGSGLADVTVSCDDGYKAHLHKLILASASLYFYHIFEEVSESKHPIIILKDVPFQHLTAILEFMYAGEVNVAQGCCPAVSSYY